MGKRNVQNENDTSGELCVVVSYSFTKQQLQKKSKEEDKEAITSAQTHPHEQCTLRKLVF